MPKTETAHTIRKTSKVNYITSDNARLCKICEAVSRHNRSMDLHQLRRTSSHRGLCADLSYAHDPLRSGLAPGLATGEGQLDLHYFAACKLTEKL